MCKVPVTFGAARNAIRMNPVWPTLRIHSENRYAFSVLTDRAETLLDALRQSDSVKSAVEKNLLAVLHTGDVGIHRIAPLLGMSRQTLYRRLKSEGVTYQSVLDDLRRRAGGNLEMFSQHRDGRYHHGPSAGKQTAAIERAKTSHGSIGSQRVKHETNDSILEANQFPHVSN